MYVEGCRCPTQSAARRRILSNSTSDKKHRGGIYAAEREILVISDMRSILMTIIYAAAQQYQSIYLAASYNRLPQYSPGISLYRPGSLILPRILVASRSNQQYDW